MDFTRATFIWPESDIVQACGLKFLVEIFTSTFTHWTKNYI